MGHRALVAYERPDGRYDRHYAHWGATSLALRHKITAKTPFAGEGKSGIRWKPAIEPTPQDTALSCEETAKFDFQQIEAFYVVSLAWVVTTYIPLWFGPTERADRRVGALVAVCDDHDAVHVREWFRATRAVVRDMVGRGVLGEHEATNYLASRTTEWAGEHREVITVV
ncbi:hypothetical protein SAMN05421858_0536 [Haladaptatus litoreus]|uniref:Uncharacterized protein n=1 Tax=Haladaptatus litoreus TaxID=553468 RepID=A0A1N6VYL2_9EURY|nr:DUF6735 family protein [Haladaptatus litoreus]SIQ82904.1 hypothetical protein SAMN05421858_0536 [Haladaptatus litoreus]